MKKLVFSALFAIFIIIPAISYAGWFGGNKEEMKIGFVNMNEIGLNEINRQVDEYGKKLAEERDFAVLREELKKAEEEARNTSEAIVLKEKIRPLLEAWEKAEKLKDSGDAEEIKTAENNFQKLMADPGLTEAYGKFHSLVGSDEKVVAKRKELMEIKNKIGTMTGKKRIELTEDFYQKVKIICSEIAGGKYSIILGVTEFSSDGKQVLKKIEILYCDKNSVEDLTEKMANRKRFFKEDK